MKVNLDDFLSTLKVLSQVSSQDEIPQKCVADASETRLYYIDSAKGRAIRRLRVPFGIFGKTHKKCLESVLQKIEAAFKDFIAFLNTSIEKPSPLTQDICVYSFDPQWRRLLEHASTLLKLKQEIPFPIALRYAIPLILKQLSTEEIPWKTFNRILQNNTVDDLDTANLKLWMADLQEIMSTTVEKIIFEVFRYAAHTWDESATEDELTLEASRLAFLLYNSSKDFFQYRSAIKDRELLQRIQKEVAQGAQKLQIDFCAEAHITTFPFPGDETRTIMVSPRRLMLSIIAEYLRRQRNIFPLLPLKEQQVDGEYLIVDGLVSSLDRVNWGRTPGITQENRALADSLAEIVKIALTLSITPKLEIKKFLVTHSSHICLVEQLPERDKGKGFSLPTIEVFIRDACKGDRARMHYVMDQSGIFNHWSVKVLEEVLQDFSQLNRDCSPQERKIIGAEWEIPTKGKTPNEPIVERIVIAHIRAKGMPLRDLQEDIVNGWIRPICFQIQRAVTRLKKNVPSNDLINCIKELQKERGFITQIPSNLSSFIIQKIEKEEFSQTQIETMGITRASTGSENPSKEPSPKKLTQKISDRLELYMKKKPTPSESTL